MVLEKLLSHAHVFSFLFVFVVDGDSSLVQCFLNPSVYHGSFQPPDGELVLWQCFLIPSDYDWVSCDLSFQPVDGGPDQGQSVSFLV